MFVRSSLAILLILGGLASRAQADDAELARGLFKKGVEEFKQKKYEVASATLAKSYELDPKPDALFALAQAERLAGHCPAAIPHYKKMVEITTDLPTLKAVQSNLDICVPPKIEKPVEKPVDRIVEKPVDRIVEKRVDHIVTRTDHKTDVLVIGGFAGGALFLGTSVGFFLAASNNSSDSDKATTLAESNRLYDRSVDQKRIAFVTGTAGVVLVGFGVYRLVKKKSSSRAEVALVPTHGGAVAWLGARW